MEISCYADQIGLNGLAASLELTLPKSVKTVEVHLSAGTMEIEDFDCKALTIDNSMGSFNASRLQADVLDVSTSMGDIEIQDSIFQVANLYCDPVFDSYLRQKRP